MEKDSNGEYAGKLLKLLEESLRQNPPVAPAELFYDSQTKSIIKELEKIGGEISLLDYGCGNLRLLKGLKSQPKPIVSNYIATDVILPSGKGFDKNDFEFITVTDLRQKYSSYFDVIILMNVIHEVSIKTIATILEDIRRLLKPGGLLFLMDMSILPEGEPLALPFYSWEFEFLFKTHQDFSYSSKKGIPIVFLKIPKEAIPAYPALLALLKALFQTKRDSYSDLACQLHDPLKKEEYDWLIKKLSLSGNNLYDLSLLMLLSGHANYRLIEEATSNTTSDNDIIETAIQVLEYFFDTFRKTGKIVTLNNIFQQVGSSRSYDQIRFAVLQMSSTWGGFFFPLKGDDLPLQPTESIDAFEDHYNYDDIREMGLLMIQYECHNKMWPE